MDGADNEQRGNRQIRHKRLVGYILIIVLAAAMTPLLLVWAFRESGPDFSLTESGGYFHVEYEWNYKGSRWQYEADVPKSMYEYFSGKERSSSYREYVLNSYDDESMKHIADRFTERAGQEGWGDFETVSFVLAFVQSMPYTSDRVTTGYDEYPRYPIETLVDGGGDCEDTSILFASIIREMGYGVVLLLLEQDDHMAVGVRISQDVVVNWRQGYPLTYYTQDGKIYAYCETTGDGWELGHKPADLLSATARLIDIS